MGDFLINKIPMQIITATRTINAKSSISPNRMEMVTNGTEIEDFVKEIINEEIRTPENIAYIKSLVLEVLIEQELVTPPPPES